MEVFNSLFGLRVRSNLHIPGLIPSSAANGAPDVEIHLGGAPGASGETIGGPEELIYASSYTTDSGDPALHIWKIASGAFLRLDYFDGMQFWLDPAGTALWAVWPAGSSLEDAAAYLLGPVFGLVLRLRGVTCLHASAVTFENGALAFAGCEGAGKSTTAAALARRGHAVISDDIVALVERDRTFFVRPAYPYLSLWPESVKIIYGSDKSLPLLSPSLEKRQLFLAENHLRFAREALPLRAIFLLGARSPDAAAPFAEELPPRERLLSLVANSYATNLLDMDMRASEFELLGRLLATVPVWRLRPHQDGTRIDRLCDLIEEKCGELGVARS